MKKFLTAFIFIFWFVSIASAGELITGAFGINLGEPFDPGIAKKGRGEFVNVEPKFPNKLFDNYVLHITPTTKKVIIISATGMVQKCPPPEFPPLIAILSKKYGNPSNEDYGRLYERVWKDAKSGMIKLACFDIAEEGFTATLFLDYIDTQMLKTNLMEKEEIDIRSIDPSGL